MPGPGRPRKVNANAAAVVPTPEPEVAIRELTLEDQHQKRTEIMNQMKDNLWHERQWDSAMAMQILSENGFDCPSHSLPTRQQVIKAVEIDHEIGVAADERAAYQRSLRERGWRIYEQFGIEYLTQPTCEWARFQRWCTHEFTRLSLSFRKQETSGQEYIEKAKKVYRTMNDFQATYWDRLRQDRVELEYQKWLFAVRKSVQEQELPVDMVWDIEAGEVILNTLKATSAESIKRFMEDECHFLEQHASSTQQWIAHKVGSSKLIFGLSPEHRGLVPSPQTPPPSEGSDTETGTHGAINDDEGEVSEEELSPANIPPATRIIHGGLWPSKQLGAKKRFNDKRLPPLPNKEPWILEWDDMTDAQKASMRDIHYGENDEYHRPPRKFAPAPNNAHAPRSASKNPTDLDQEDQNNDLAGQQDRDGAAATAETCLETLEELELSNQTETRSIQQRKHEAAAAQSTKDSQPMEKSDSTGPNPPLMIGPNENGDDGSKHPSQGGGIPSKGHYEQKSVMIDDDDDGSKALDDVEDNWLDPEVEARVVGGSPATSSRRTHAERGPGRPERNRGPENDTSQNPEPSAAQPAAAQPTAEPTAQSTRVREAVLFRTPIVPAPEASTQPPGLPQRGTFGDVPNSDILGQQRTSAPLSGGTYNADAGLNVSSTMDPRLGTIVRPPRIERPRIGPRPDNMNQRLNAAVRRASQTPAPSGNGFVPVNKPVPHGQPSANTNRPNVPAAQVKPSGTPVSQSTGPVSVPPRLRANEQATGMLVRNTDGTLPPASSTLKRRRSQASQKDEDFRQRRFSSNGNHLNQQMPSPENFGIPARNPWSVSTSSTHRPSVPMMPQTSHSGFNNTPRHPQQQGQMNGVMTPPMQHGGFSQRKPTQNFGNQARDNNYQNPNMMHQVSSMNYTGLSGNVGAGATQTQAPQIHISTMNGYDVEKCPVSNGYSGHRGYQPFQQPNTMNGSRWPNMPNNMDSFASPHMQNFTNGFGMIQASPNMPNSAHRAFGQPSHVQHNSIPSGYGMAQSSPDMHNSMHGNRMAQPPSGLRRHRPSIEKSQLGRPTGMRYGQDVPMNQRRPQSEIQHMRQDQPGYKSPMRTSNTPHSDMQLNGSIEAPRITRPVNGQTSNGGPPPPGSRTQPQPGGATSNNEQNARATVGQSPSTNTSQRQQAPQTVAPTNDQPNQKRRGPGRPRRSQSQHPQTQSQNPVPVPAPPTQPAFPRAWTADQSVYSNRPVNTAHGQLYFEQPPPVLRHVPLPPSGSPFGTGSLLNIEPIEQNYTDQNMQVQATAFLEHQLSVARELGLSLQPPSASPANPQPNMNNPAAVLARQQHAPQPEQVPQQEPAAKNPFIDPSSLSLFWLRRLKTMYCFNNMSGQYQASGQRNRLRIMDTYHLEMAWGLTIGTI